MSAAPNFFTSGGTLARTAKSYVTRRADLDLLQHMRGGDFCYVLTSRQMGKSSLMVHTADSLRKENVNVAILDLTRIGQNVSVEQWYDGLLIRLGAELNLEEELDDYWVSDRAARFGPMQRFMHALREVVLPAVKGQVAIFVDEIDAVRSLPFSSDEFFAGIRECYNSRVGDPEYNRLSFCLLGVAQPSDLISNVYLTPFNIGHRIELTDFNETEAQPLLEGLRSKSTKAGGAEAILHRVIYWTGGHPYLTQKLCEMVGGLDKSDVTPKDVDAVCQDLFLSTRSREQQDNLIFVRDRVLASTEDRASILDLYAKVLRGEKVRDDDSNAIIDALRLSGLLVVSKGYLKVRNRIYATVFDRHWVIANMPDAELRRQKAAYRRGITLAFGISLPILALILLLVYLDWKSERKEVQESYVSSTNSAEEAFDMGDFTTGKVILDPWEQKSAGLSVAVQNIWEGRSALESSFPMRLLLAEAEGEDNSVIPRQGEPSGGKKAAIYTSCGEEMAVATTIYNKNIPLIAVAGADSSVQIWQLEQGDTLVPFAHIQLNAPDGKTVVASPTLNNCPAASLNPEPQPGIMSLNFSPDGSMLSIGTGTWRNADSPGTVWLWSMADLSNIKEAPIPKDDDFHKTVDWTEFSDDGEYLAASSEDATVKIWRVVNNNLQAPTTIDPTGLLVPNTKHDTRVGETRAHIVVLSSDVGPAARHLMAVGYGDGHLLLYDYRHPEAKPLYEGIVQVSGIMSMVFVEAKDKVMRLLIGSRDGDLLSIDPEKLIETYPNSSGRPAVTVTIQPNQGVLQGMTVGYNDAKTEAWLLTSGSNGTVGIWSITPTLHILEIFSGHHSGVHAAGFCPIISSDQSDCIVSASSDHNAMLWKFPYSRREEVDDHMIKGGLMFPGQMVGVDFITNDKLVTAVGATTAVGAATSEDHSGVIATWDLNSKTADALREYETGIKEEPVLGFGVSPDGKFTVSTVRSQKLVFLDLANAYSKDVMVHATLTPKIQIRCVDGVQVVPDEECKSKPHEYLVMGVSDQYANQSQQYQPGRGLCMWHFKVNGGRDKTEFSRDQAYMNPCDYSSSNTQTAKDLQPGSTYRDLLSRASMFDISPDGKKIVLSIVTGARVCVAVLNTADLLQYKLPDAKAAVNATPGCISEKSAGLTGGFDTQLNYISFSNDGKFIAATDTGTHMYYWPVEETEDMPDLKKAKHSYQVPLSARGQVLAFDPAEGILAIGQQDSNILLWGTESHQSLMTIHKHTGGVLGLAFSPDGSTLASAGNDGLVSILHAKSK